MMKAIIIDDQPAACEAIEILLRGFEEEITVCGRCANITDAIHAIGQHTPDLLFLDVELADGSGFEILEKLPDLTARVIFVTAYEHFALKAIRHNALDYLLKPVDPGEFAEVMRKAVKEVRGMQRPDMRALLRMLKAPEKIAVPDRHGLHYYAVEDIVLLEAQGNYTEMHLHHDKPVLVSRLIKDFESLLAGKGFMRVHKSFLVNLGRVAAYLREDSGYLLMDNARRIPISPKEKEAVLKALKACSETL